MNQIYKGLGWALAIAWLGCSQNAERSDQRLMHETETADDTSPNGEDPNDEDPGEMEGEEPTPPADDTGTAPSMDTGGGAPTDTGVMDTAGGTPSTDTGVMDAGPPAADGLYLDFILHFAGPASDPRPNNCIFLRTTAGRSIDVGGYVVRSENHTYTFPAGTRVPASGPLTVHWNSAGTDDSDDVWTGPGLNNLSTLEDEVMVMRPASAANRVVAYVRWDTDGTFGNAPTDPYGTSGVSSPTTSIAVAAGAWDASYVNVAGVNFASQAIQLVDRSTAPGTTASDWFIVTK